LPSRDITPFYCILVLGKWGVDFFWVVFEVILRNVPRFRGNGGGCVVRSWVGAALALAAAERCVV
jgi:hypothetical protein